MLQAADIEAALRQQLPAEYHSAIPHLAQALAEASTGAVSPAEAQAALPGLADALRALAGREVQTNNALITFGSGNQLGNVTINDVAGRDVITLHFNLGVQQTINVSGGTVGKVVGEEINTGGGDYAEGSIDKRQGAFVSGSMIQGDVIGQQTVIKADLSRRDRDNRQRMLKQVQESWIEGVLEQSLYKELLIALNLQTDPQAVSFTGPQLAAVRDQGVQALPPGTSIAQVYRQANQRLLILGAPGAGKTTLLLDLTRHLLNEARYDETRPIPVIFNLSSWAQQRLPLQSYLVQELRDQYGVGRRIAQQWIWDNSILPMLDGLDEVPRRQRSSCIAAINTFLKEHGVEGIVICSRIIDYQLIGTKLSLDVAVQVQPLDDTQITGYLNQIGQPLASVQNTLVQDVEMRELVRTPMSLSIFALAYHNQTPHELTGLSEAAQRRRLFDSYIQRMFDRSARSDSKSYPHYQTLAWLHWLASCMIQDNQTVLQIEMMQPWWLQRLWQRGLYVLYSSVGATISGAILGLLFGISLGMIFALSLETLIWLFPDRISALGILNLPARGEGLMYSLGVGAFNGVGFGVILWMTTGLLVSVLQRPPALRRNWQAVSGGLLAAVLVYLCLASIGLGGLSTFWVWSFSTTLVGVLTGVLIRRGMIRTTETLRWSWSTLRIHWYFSLIFTLIFGLVFGLTIGAGIGINKSMEIGVFNGLFFGLGFALLTALSVGVVNGLIQPELQAKTRPNQGTWHTLWNALSAWLVGGPIFGLCVGLVLGLSGGVRGGLIGGLAVAFVFGMSFGLGGGPIAGLYFGGLAFVQHFALRAVCSLSNYAPLRYSRFLDYAVERILLRRVGGGYIFIHRMLMEHFAAMTDEDIARIAGEVEKRRGE